MGVWLNQAQVDVGVMKPEPVLGLTAMALGFEPRQRAVGAAAAASESRPDLGPACLPSLRFPGLQDQLRPQACSRSWHWTSGPTTGRRLHQLPGGETGQGRAEVGGVQVEGGHASGVGRRSAHGPSLCALHGLGVGLCPCRGALVARACLGLG